MLPQNRPISCRCPAANRCSLGREPGGTSGWIHGLGYLCSAFRREGLISDELSLQLSTFLRSLDLLLELRVRPVPPAKSHTQAATAWRQAGHRWSRAFAFSFQHPPPAGQAASEVMGLLSLPGIVQFRTQTCLTNWLTPCGVFAARMPPPAWSAGGPLTSLLEPLV